MNVNIKNNDKKYTVYKIEGEYKVKKNIDDTFDCETYIHPINSMLKRLEKNKGYHLRVNEDEKTIIFLDVDNVPDENTFNNLIGLLCKEFDLLPDEIKYTKSIKLDNTLSYHLSIPKIECVVGDLKKEFSLPVYNEFSKYIDLSVYSKKFFRLPNQTNKTKPLPHTIINGCMKDFILQYTDESTNFYEYTEPTDETDNEETEEEIEEDKEKIDKIENIIKCFHPSRSDNNEDWIQTLWIIKNELGINGKEIFRTFSK